MQVGGWSSVAAEKAGVEHGLYYTHLLALGTTWLEHRLEHDLWSMDFAVQTNEIVKVTRQTVSKPPDTRRELMAAF